MDRGKGNGCSGDGQKAGSSSRKGKKPFHRHTVRQVQVLEAFFKECPHPDEKQRHRLAKELGLDPIQIKFWFQNKRTHTKVLHQRADNYTLRNENEKILCENLTYKEALKNMICSTCGGCPVQKDDKQTTLHKLRMEHLQLREQYNRISAALTKHLGKPVSQISGLLSSYTGSVLHSSPSGYPGNHGIETSLVDPDGNPNVIPCNPTLLAQQIKGMLGTSNDCRVEFVAEALRELVNLFQMNEPLWIKSTCGKYTLDHKIYEKMFSRVSHRKIPNARIESSKDSKNVNISAIDLVCMLLNPDQWAHNFCTIVTKAETIEVINSNILGQQSGHLQLMYAQMHILSPLVASREFHFLRYCQQMDVGIWVVVDVSYDYIKENILASHSWRFPSGCMIQELPNGFSKVTWVEHVAVEDKTQTHKLYREILDTGFAYGAERWTSALQRMGERLSSTMFQNSPNIEHEGAINLPEMKRNIMKLSHRMVKNFCSILTMSSKLDFPQVSDVDTSGVKVSISKNLEVDQSNSIIVSAATSLWLPLPLDVVFHFLTDENTRSQWDVLSCGNPVQRVAHINTANQLGNFISVIMPTAPNETNKLILQESSMDNLSALIVHAPIDIPSFNIILAGEDTLSIPLLPSGFTIIADGRQSCTSSGTQQIAGSLLTVIVQILVINNSSTSERVNMESIANANTIISTTTEKIKIALNCGSMD